MKKRKTVLLLFLTSLLIGVGWCAIQYRDIVPSLEGDAYSILAADEGAFMILSDRQNNCLVRVDDAGLLLNFCKTGRSEAFQYLDAESGTIYAILNTYANRKLRQSLVSLPLDQISMRPKQLSSLSDYPSVQWKELYPPYAGEEGKILLTGVDSEKQAWLLRYDLQTGETAAEKILPGVRVYQIKYVEAGRYVYIDSEGRLGQFQNGERQPDILNGLAKTPMHISTCGTRCFVSDSNTGAIYELFREGKAELSRDGLSPMGDGYTYADLKLFTTRERDGVIRVMGLCQGGAGNVVMEEEQSPIRAVRIGAAATVLLFGRSILLVTGTAFLGLGALFLLIRQIAASRRVLVRMALSTALVTVLLLAGIISMQRRVFLDSLQGEAIEKFKLISGNLIGTLNSRDSAVDWPDLDFSYHRELGGYVQEQFELLRSRMTSGNIRAADATENVNISILYFQGDKPLIYYDKTVPWGYEVGNIKKGEYISALNEALAAGNPLAAVVHADLLDELLFAESFHDEVTGRKGCVVIEQPVADATAAVGELDKSMRIYVVIGPVLLAALVLIYWRFLRPLKEIKEAMDQFYESGSGNQIFMRDGMVKDEFYDISRTFNKLSMETRVQMNQLNTINSSYARFVPDRMLEILEKNSILEVRPGDCARINAGILIAAPASSTRLEQETGQYLTVWSDEIAGAGGIITDYDESTRAVTAVFPDGPDAAWKCAKSCCRVQTKEKLRGLMIVHGAELLYGVWGSEALLHPAAVSEDIKRLIQLLPTLSGFNCTVAVCGAAVACEEEMRPLGRLAGDSSPQLWEAYEYAETGRAFQRRKTLDVFRQGLELFESQRFRESQVRFARVLREDPEDGAAKWYLFRCEELSRARDSARVLPGR